MKTALLVIDVQHGLFHPAPRPFEADEVVHRINALTQRARAAGVAVAFIQHERATDWMTFGSESWQLAQHLTALPEDELIRKRTPDSFLNTTLGDWLTAQDVGRLVICGYATEFCVDTTTRSAAGLGYEVVLAADAHTTHDKAHASAAQIRAHHNATLPCLTSFGPSISAVNSLDVTFRAAAVN